VSQFPTTIEEPGKLLPAVCDQLRAVPRSGSWYGALRYLSPDAGTRACLQAQPTPEINFDYLGNQGAAPLSGDWTPVPGVIAGRFSPEESRDSILQVRAVVYGRQMSLDVQCSRAIHQRSTIEALADGFVDAVHGVLAEIETSSLGGR
jgi:non-ribosomal peptide synthase protein (TIGR01720 family)